LLLSTGEIDLDQHIQRQRSGKQSADPGERNRLLNIPIEDLSPPRDPSEIEALKRDCGRFFGTAGPEFVQALLDTFTGDVTKIQENLQFEIEAQRKEYCDALAAEGWTLDTSHRRAIRRFALIAVVGQWASASQSEVLPHTQKEVLDSVDVVLRAWLSGQPFSSQDDHVITTFRNYVQCYEGQMRSTDNPDRIPPHSTGYLDNRHRDGPRLLLNEVQFNAACQGLNPKSAQVALKSAGILHTNDDQFKTKVSVHEFGIKKLRLYWLKLSLLRDDPTLDDLPDQDVSSPRHVSAPLRREQRGIDHI